jgi:hypothetical protein
MAGGKASGELELKNKIRSIGLQFKGGGKRDWRRRGGGAEGFGKD